MHRPLDQVQDILRDDDVAELCCAAGACCDDEKRQTELAELITRWCGHHITAAEAAAAVHEHFILLPKALGFGPAFMAYGDMIRQHPTYEKI